MLNPTLGFILLFVKDPAISATFYAQIFNLKPVEQSSTFALFALNNGVMLGLWSHKTAEPEVTALPGAMEIAFADEDVDALYDRCKHLRINVIQTPTEMDFGRTFVALDPDGHRIRIYKLRSAE